MVNYRERIASSDKTKPRTRTGKPPSPCLAGVNSDTVHAHLAPETDHREFSSHAPPPVFLTDRSDAASPLFFAWPTQNPSLFAIAMKIRYALSACLLVTAPAALAQSIEQNLNQAIQEAAQSSVNRSQQANEMAQEAYRSTPADALASLDPTALYTVEDRYRGAWSAPAFGPRIVGLLGSSWLDQQTGLSRDALMRAVADRMVAEGYLFFRIQISPRSASTGPEFELQPLPVKVLDNGLQLKNILYIRDGDFFRLSQLRLALYQLNNKGESTYKADVVNVENTIYLSFSQVPRSRVTTVINLNNFNKKDLFGYNGSISLLASDLLNLNESFGLTYSNNLATVQARNFSAYNGYFSVPILGVDLMMDYNQSSDRSFIELGRSILQAQRNTENYGLGLKRNHIDGDTLFYYGLRAGRNNSRFDINKTRILAQTYRYGLGELSGGVSYRKDSFYASGSAILSRSFQYDRGNAFSTLRTHAEAGDRFLRQWRYRVSLNAQQRLGGAPLPSSELFYPNSPTRTRLPFNAAPLSGEHGMNLSSTLSYDIARSSLHRGWVAVGTISPFVGLDHGRAGRQYITSATLGVNVAVGQNRLQFYWPKILGSNASHRADGGIFLSLQAQF